MIFRNTWNEHLLRSACSWLSFGKIFAHIKSSWNPASSRGFDPNKLQAVDVSGIDVSSSAHLKATFKVHQTNPTRSNHQWLCVCVKKTAIHIPYKFKFDYSLKTYHLWTEPHLVPCLIHVQLLFELISRAPIPFVRWQLRPGCHPGARPGARDDPDGTEVFVFPTVSQKNPSHYTYYINLYHLYQSISIYINLYHLYQSISIYINLYQSISIYIYLYQSISVYINLYQSISICINLYQSISIYINLYQSISIYINLYLSISIYINLYQSISIYINLYHINII